MVDHFTLYEPHPLAKAYPPLSPDALRRLADDIKINGLIDPIVLIQDHSGDPKILDGWHRFQACVTENIEPQFIYYTGDDPTAFVHSKNLHRRHLSVKEQRAAAKAILTEHPERTNRSVAKETHLSATTVGTIREEVEAETIQPNALSGQSEWTEYDPDSKPDIVAAPQPRVESTGRKARGRKPDTPAQKKEKAAAKAAKVQKETQPARVLGNAREQLTVEVTNRFKSDVDEALHDMVSIIRGHEGPIRERVTEFRRKVLVRQFVGALGFTLPEEF